MSEIHTQVIEETQEVVISENATITPEPALEVQQQPTPAPILTLTPAIKEVKQQSRFSLAFQRISGGCGFCFNPLKSGSATDYHNLVVTPSDEEGPLLGGDHHHPDNNGHGSVPVAITDDYKGERHHSEAIASSSTDSHHLHHHNQHQEVHEEVKSRDITAVYEEVSTDFEVHNVITHEEQHQEQQQQMEEVSFSTQIIDTGAPATFIEEIVEDVVVDDEAALPIAATAAAVVETIPATTAAVVEEVVAPTSDSLPATPTAKRSPRTFAKLTKSKRSPSASAASSTPSSPPSTSPLLERLGRFAKIIRPSETSSSIHSKVESLKVSTAPSTHTESIVAEPGQDTQEIFKVVTKPVAVPVQKKKDEIITILAPTATVTGVPLTPVSPVIAPEVILKELSVPVLPRSDATPSLPPQPQQQQQASNNNNYNGRRNSLAVDTLVVQTLSAPVAIPSSAPTHWSRSPTTLHQNDASMANSSAGQSLSRAGRASTMDSTTEAGGSEAGSVNSNSNEHLASLTTVGKDGKDGISAGAGLKANRRKSVLKKLGKIINNMNTNTRKNSMDGNSSRKSSMEKSEKRMSRQGSLTSPLESEENFGF
ncbi:hypothetical protein BGX29_006766 [Mortierella sp. GBA35]|nr:hypothetical protein BGX23_007290 [Mortierella sp. AD031]KAF9100145.1 hypothetical protein BGX29_006766 [Mortierella sp. GBA35]KAG0204010.1 hypothetical protein BGX33_008770 [Mortierella sp. NVP41]